MAITEVSEDSFKSEVLDFDGVVLVDFWAPWCGPCQMLGPVVEEVSAELEGNDKMKVCKLNVDENQGVAQQYGIMSIPALKFFKGGNVVGELVGMQQKETIIEKFNSLIAN